MLIEKNPQIMFRNATERMGGAVHKEGSCYWCDSPWIDVLDVQPDLPTLRECGLVGDSENPNAEELLGAKLIFYLHSMVELAVKNFEAKNYNSENGPEYFASKIVEVVSADISNGFLFLVGVFQARYSFRLHLEVTFVGDGFTREDIKSYGPLDWLPKINGNK